MENNHSSLVYIHDPMCSWCWAFAPQYEKLIEKLPHNINHYRVLGGLAPDSNEAMPEQMQAHLQEVWRTISERVPGTVFNFDFWKECQPRRSTYPACRGVIAARAQGDDWERPMIRGIQLAYYLQAKNPSNNQTLIEIAENLRMDIGQFDAALNSNATNQILIDEINFSRQLGIQGFPSLVVLNKNRATPISVNFESLDSMLSAINELC